jgi:hypothetical protein
MLSEPGRGSCIGVEYTVGLFVLQVLISILRYHYTPEIQIYTEVTQANYLTIKSFNFN